MAKTKLDFFIEQEPTRKYFENTLRKLHTSVREDRATRQETLAAKDIRLLRSAESSILYLASAFENEWRVCLPNVVLDYLDRMNNIFKAASTDFDRECNAFKDLLSIQDLVKIKDDTDDVIHFLLNDFDPTMYRPRVSVNDRFNKWFHLIKPIPRRIVREEHIADQKEIAA